MDFQEISNHMEIEFMIFIGGSIALTIGWWVIKIVKGVIKFFKERNK